MGNFLDSPNTAKTSETFITNSNLKAGVTGMQGWRTEMEDDHISADMPSLPSHTYFAIFDGHGGSGAAIYAAKNMVSFIENTTQWKNYVAGGATDLILLSEALKQAFENIDNQLRTLQESDHSPNSDTSGCTANTAMVTPTHIVCANAGDSRCVLGTAQTVIAMSEDHKPYDDNEKRRIEAAGGTVQWKRVDGDLAVSRALGDFQYKTRRDLPGTHQKVTFLPDIIIHERTPQDDVLLLACDGLWDVMTNLEAIQLVRSIYATGEQTPHLIAEEIVDRALEKGSRDNISAIVVQLEGAVIGPAENGGVLRLRAQRGGIN